MKVERYALLFIHNFIIKPFQILYNTFLKQKEQTAYPEVLVDLDKVAQTNGIKAAYRMAETLIDPEDLFKRHNFFRKSR